MVARGARGAVTCGAPGDQRIRAPRATPTGVRQGLYITSAMPCNGKGRGRANPESPVSRPACKRWHKVSDHASSQGWVQGGSITKGKLLRPQGWAARRHSSHAKPVPVADRLTPKTKHSISPNGPKSTGSNRQGFYSRGLRELASSGSRRVGRAGRHRCRGPSRRRRRACRRCPPAPSQARSTAAATCRGAWARLTIGRF